MLIGLETWSTTGQIFTMLGGAISWNSKKQPTVALSTTEAEYMAVTQATKEAIWLRGLLKEVGHDTKEPVTIYSDNQGCISLAKNPVYHAKSKHIDIQHHFVREKVSNGAVNILYQGTEQMVADSLTKGVQREKFEFCRRGFGLTD